MQIFMYLHIFIYFLYLHMPIITDYDWNYAWHRSCQIPLQLHVMFIVSLTSQNQTYSAFVTTPTHLHVFFNFAIKIHYSVSTVLYQQFYLEYNIITILNYLRSSYYFANVITCTYRCLLPSNNNCTQDFRFHWWYLPALCHLELKPTSWQCQYSWVILLSSIQQPRCKATTINIDSPHATRTYATRTSSSYS